MANGHYHIKNGKTTIAVLALVTILLSSFAGCNKHNDDVMFGTLEPVLRYRIYSPLDAQVKQLFVEYNTRVLGPLFDDDGIKTHHGTVLLELRSPELESQEIRLRGNELEASERLVTYDRMLLASEDRLNDLERAELTGQRNRAMIQLETTREQLDIFNRHQKPQLFITSPIDGVVITFDVARRLVEQRPVNRTTYLMEIADLDGPWALELLVPERQLGYVMEQRRQHPDQPLRVEFIATVQPDKKLYGTITEIHDLTDSRASAIPNGSNNKALIKVTLDNRDRLPFFRPGVEVSARIIKQ